MRPIIQHYNAQVLLQLAFIERWLHYRGRLQCFSAMLALFGAREAGWFREVAALYSDHYKHAGLLFTEL